MFRIVHPYISTRETDGDGWMGGGDGDGWVVVGGWVGGDGWVDEW